MQNNRTFQTSAHAKCILAGEHAVLYGCPAVVIPIHNKVINLLYEEVEKPIETECRSPFEDTFLLFFWNIFQHGLERLHKNRMNLRGKFYIQNNIPIAAGMGFSSALCLVLTRWFIWEHWVNEKKIFQFAQKFENHIHGRSSGVDVAGAMSDHTIHYEKSGNIHELEVNWHPNLYLSYSGNTKYTSNAVKQVQMMRKKHPALAKLIDDEMKKSVSLIEEGLIADEKHGLSMLASAIQHANHCFQEWELIPSDLQHHMDELRNLGALATKPTGAGIGGYVLSLWDKTPPRNHSIELMPIFADR